jgi:high-affinity Fe2+/Pb2+ permease
MKSEDEISLKHIVAALAGLITGFLIGFLVFGQAR